MTLSPSQSQEDSFRHIFHLSLPVIGIQLSVTLMQFVDALMIKPLGKDAMAAIFPAALLYILLVGTAAGILTCISTFVSQSLGKGDRKECGFYTWQGIFIAVAMGILFCGLIPFSGAIFRIFNHAPEVQMLERTYFSISLIGIIPNLVMQACSNFFVGIHKTRILLVYAAIATLLNILFNYVLIYGKLGFPAMGLAGSALGTALAIFCQGLGLLVHFLLPKYANAYATRHMVHDWHAIRKLLHIGIPSGIQLAFEISSWSVALIWLVGFFGTDHLAATTIVTRWLHLSFMPTLGIAITLMAIAGKAIGEGNPELANRQTYRVACATMIYMGCMGVVFFVFRRPLMQLFSESPHVVAIGAQIMILAAVFQVFDASQMVFGHALRGAGDTRWPAITSGIVCVSLFVIGGFLTVKLLPQWESFGPWAMASLYMIVLGIAMPLRWRYGPWRKICIFRRGGNSAGNN